ncbi:MAG TPA: DUF1501 domain-containing protein, partial [Verrucomicrobiales bacterium]|nr:DUF1501 domain-containing protein [Verrucomicrobiales bacterium]
MTCNDHLLFTLNEAARRAVSRRSFLQKAAGGIGLAALGSLLTQRSQAAGGLPGLPHFAPKAKRIIYLFQSGAPSQMDLFDPKPQMASRRGEDLPASI